MRRTIVAIGAGLAVGLSTAAAFAASNASAGDMSTSTAPANGLSWCGFHDKAGDRVRCGYSSESNCKRAIGEPGAICIVDPYLTQDERPRMPRRSPA
jgi:hypothetical protein